MSAAPTGTLEVLDGGLLTTLQDVRGRRGYAALGVSTAGAMDWFAAEAANALLDNAADAAMLEVTMHGPVLRFTAATAFSLTGADLSATLDGASVSPGRSYFARARSVLAFGERRAGVRAYVAVAGGLDVPVVLGSRATDLRASLGRGRLQQADELRYPLVADAPLLSGRAIAAPFDVTAHVRVLPGPHAQRFAPDALQSLCARPWRITEQADRMGYRLRGGAPLRHLRGADIASIGLPLGAIQVPGEGHPIVLLADHQPTGGYTVLACVIQADLPILAQRQTGDEVHFAPTSLSEALNALSNRRAALREIERDPSWDMLRLTGA